MEVYDVHHHLRLEPWHDGAFLREDYERRVEIMDRNGIAKAIVTPSSHFDITHGIDDVRRVNDLVAEYVARYSSRFPAGCGFVHTSMGDASFKEIERVVKDLELKGICWHHMSLGAYLNDPIMFEFLRQLRDLGGIPVIHAFAESTWESPWRLRPLAEAFPDLPIVVLSGLFGWATSEEMIWVAQKYPSLLVDAVLFPVNLWIERVVKAVGVERVLYGSDLVALPEAASYHRAQSLIEIEASPNLTDLEKQQILGANLRRVFSLK